MLVATDHGNPRAFETLRLLNVLLVDTDDNIPQFHDEYNFNVPENHPKDFFVGMVTAEDKDEGRHARVYYYIEAGTKINRKSFSNRQSNVRKTFSENFVFFIVFNLKNVDFLVSCFLRLYTPSAQICPIF